MSFLYLTQKNRCPHCYVHRNGSMDGQCHNCGTRLFPNINYDFHKFEDETPFRYWWAWSGDEIGWKHRDHFMIATAKPQERYQPETKIDVNYGRQTTPDEVAASNGKIVRTVKKSKIKIPKALKS